eukprot:Hpha_TRINITY_DN33739_c0_g1::TRINITY_DN33739_c0_g1_i1::g.25155::m.25155
MVMLLAAAVPLLTAAAWDLSWVVGGEYTPARAPNSLWWWQWQEYTEDVQKELHFASKHLGLNHVRMFLHPMVYDGVSGDDQGKTLFEGMNTFIGIAEREGIRPSFVFFDDCWNRVGANLSDPCVPTQGKHNGCWFTSPQTVQRTTLDRFQSYVYETVHHFAQDTRVAFWEVYNEPQKDSNFSIALRDAAYGWVRQALKDGGQVPQRVPVLSCWDDNNDTQVVDMHRYDSDFGSWTKQIFQNPDKHALITEGGARWYQGYPEDSGSPVMVFHWANHLRSISPSAVAPFKFGMVTNWEVMVGNSNTRWHWNTKDGTPEPVIPWDGYIFPDGTPVSHTEAAVMRNFSRGVDDFLGFDNFLPDTHALEGDSFLCLPAGSHHDVTIKSGVDPVGSRVLVESTIWLSNSTGGGVLVRSGDNASSGYFAGWRSLSPPTLTLEVWERGEARTVGSYDMTEAACGLTGAGWNMLRVVAEWGRLSVYANPTHADAIAGGISPRISWSDPNATFENGGVSLVGVGSGSGCTRFDYVGVLPPTVL